MKKINKSKLGTGVYPVLKSLNLLGLDGDEILKKIHRDLADGFDKEARSHLNFVDKLLDIYGRSHE